MIDVIMRLAQLAHDHPQIAEIEIDLHSGQTATLVVAGPTRHTRSIASYSVEVR